MKKIWNKLKNKKGFYLVCIIITLIFICMPYPSYVFKVLNAFITYIFGLLNNILIYIFSLFNNISLNTIIKIIIFIIYFCMCYFFEIFKFSLFIFKVIYVVNSIITKLISDKINFIVYILLYIFLLYCMTKLVYLSYFNGIEQFDRDSKFICTLGLFGFVILNSIILLLGNEVTKQVKKSSVDISLIILLLSLYIWIIYLIRCRKVISEINKDWHLFLAKMVKSMVTATLVCFSGIMIIMWLSKKYNITKVFYQIIFTTINLNYPLLDMYAYVRSEIDDFKKQEKEKY